MEAGDFLLCKVLLLFVILLRVFHIDFLDPSNIGIRIRKILIINLEGKSIFQNVVREIQMHSSINIIQKFSLSAVVYIYIYTHNTVQLTRVQDSSFGANYTQLVVQIWMSYLRRFILPYCAHLFLVVHILLPHFCCIIFKILPMLVENKVIYNVIFSKLISLVLYNFFSYVKYIFCTFTFPRMKAIWKISQCNLLFDVKKYLILIRAESNINFKSYVIEERRIFCKL